jgi:hypothetical protein
VTVPDSRFCGNDQRANDPNLPHDNTRNMPNNFFGQTNCRRFFKKQRAFLKNPEMEAQEGHAGVGPPHDLLKEVLKILLNIVRIFNH